MGTSAVIFSDYNHVGKISMKYLLFIAVLVTFCASTSFCLMTGLSVRTLRHQRLRTKVLPSFRMTVRINIAEGESTENIYKRFKRACNQSGHLMTLRYKEHWETAADKKKRKRDRAKLLNKIERTNDMYERRAFGSNEYNS